jgi:GAF domain-containing protein
MSVVNISSSRTLPDPEVEQVEQLAVSFSGRLNRAHHLEVASAIADALDQIAAVTHVGACVLIEFAGSGSVFRTHVGTATASDGGTRGLDATLLRRLARGESVGFPEDDAARDGMSRGYGLPEATGSVLGIPGSANGQLICALVLHNPRTGRRWSPPLVDRLQLVAEILASAVLRLRLRNHRARAPSSPRS